MEFLAIGYVDVDHQSQEECLTYEQSRVLVLLSLQFPPQGPPFAGRPAVVTIALVIVIIVSMSRLPCQPRVAITMTAILVAQYRYYNNYRYQPE